MAAPVLVRNMISAIKSVPLNMISQIKSAPAGEPHSRGLGFEVGDGVLGSASPMFPGTVA